MEKIKLWDKILGAIGLARKKAVDIPLASGAGIFTIGAGAGRIPKAKLLENNKNWVFACVKARAEAVGNIQLKLFQKDKNGSLVEEPDHELLNLLAAVNPFMTQFELFEATESHLDLCGNAFWLLQGVKGQSDKPTAIYPLNPKYIEIKKGSSLNLIEQYKYTVSGFSKTFQPYEILHFREFNPNDSYDGLGILESIAHWVDADNYATEWNRSFFLNAARPDATLEHEGDLDSDQMSFLRASFEDAYKGVEKAHKAIILPKGVKFSPVGWNQKEMDFVEMQRMTRDKIMAGFRVPKTILGLTEDVNRANAEASNYVFALRVVKPQMERIVGYLNEFLVPRFGDNIFLSFADPVPENKEQEIVEYEKALAGQAYASVNEIREKQGLSPVDGGDDVMTNFALQPLGRPSEKLNGKKIKIKNHGKQSAKKKIREAIKTMGKEAATAVKDVDEKRLETIWKGFISRVEPYQRALADKVKKFNEHQKEKVIFKLEGKKQEIDFNNLFDKDQEVSILIDGVTPLLGDLFQKEGTEALRSIGVQQAFGANKERVAKVLKKAISLMAEKYNETTLKDLEKTLKEGLNDGESLPELTDRVREIYEFSGKARAEQVARTESFRVANSATKEAWKQSGVVKTLRWYTAVDERVCEFCDPLNGKIVEISENWFDKGDSLAGREGGKMEIDYSDVGNPPLHVDCRCYIRPEEISID